MKFNKKKLEINFRKKNFRKKMFERWKKQDASK